MEQEPFFLALRRRWWIPVLVAGATVLVAGALALRAPRYLAAASIVAQVPINTNDQALAFSDVATSNSVDLRALTDTHVDMTLEQLQANLTVVSTRSTRYTVAVADSNAQEAVVLTNAIANEAAITYQQLAGGTTQSVTNDLEVDVSRYRDQYLTATSALLGFEAAHPQVLNNGSPVDIEAQHHQLQLDQQAAQNAFVLIEGAVAQARVSQVATADYYRATVVDSAVAKSQVASLLLKVGFAGALGLVLGLALAVVIEYLRAPRSATRLITASESNGAGGHHEDTLATAVSTAPGASKR